MSFEGDSGGVEELRRSVGALAQSFEKLIEVIILKNRQAEIIQSIQIKLNEKVMEFIMNNSANDSERKALLTFWLDSTKEIEAATTELRLRNLLPPLPGK